MKKFSRREILKGVGAAAAGIAVASPAKLIHALQTEERSNSMATPQLVAKPYKAGIMEMEGISKRTMEEHYKLYQGYINKTNEIRTKLETVDQKTANQVFSDLRVLKVELTFALGGVKNHEIYFDNLGGKGGQPAGKLSDAIKEFFGSYDTWAADLKATGIAARGWAWLAWDYDERRLFNFLGDAQNTFPVWNAVPVVALDTYEHAYFIDYGVNRGAYIDSFMKNLDWAAIQKRFDAIKM